MTDKKQKGIFVKGIVVGRTRKSNVGKNLAELITYKIDTDNGALFVKDWSPKEYFELGTIIDEPVRISIYNGKFDLAFLGSDLYGENF